MYDLGVLGEDRSEMEAVTIVQLLQVMTEGGTERGTVGW